MKLHFDGLTWDVVIWPGRQHQIWTDKLDALGVTVESIVDKLSPPGQFIVARGRTAAGGGYVVVQEPQEVVNVMRDHDLGDCDERILRSR